jgi:tripartite-type tricarboxylate transporter receptor subunit TctC
MLGGLWDASSTVLACAAPLGQHGRNKSWEEDRMTRARIPSLVGILAAALVGVTFGAAAGKAADSPFPTLTIVLGSAAGTAYDLYVRVFAAHFPAFLPGKPAVVVQNMPGANGDLSINYMITSGAKDGTVIASAVSPVPNRPLLHPEISKYDVTRLNWIGSITQDAYVAFIAQPGPIQTYEEAKQKEAVVGGIAVGAPTIDLPVVSNALFGTKFKIVTGYGAESAVELAIERGELNGSFAAGYAGFKAAHGEWLKSGKAKIILQHGLRPLPDLPDVPLFISQARNEADRETLEFLLAPQDFAKPFYAPPGVPAERLEVLRSAFDATMNDP